MDGIAGIRERALIFTIERGNMSKMNGTYLAGIVEHMAKTYYDGHYTIFKFTTEYKVVFGTPDNVKILASKLIGRG